MLGLLAVMGALASGDGLGADVSRTNIIPGVEAAAQIAGPLAQMAPVIRLEPKQRISKGGGWPPPPSMPERAPLPNAPASPQRLPHTKVPAGPLARAELARAELERVPPPKVPAAGPLARAELARAKLERAPPPKVPAAGPLARAELLAPGPLARAELARAKLGWHQPSARSPSSPSPPLLPRAGAPPSPVPSPSPASPSPLPSPPLDPSSSADPLTSGHRMTASAEGDPPRPKTLADSLSSKASKHRGAEALASKRADPLATDEAGAKTQPASDIFPWVYSLPASVAVPADHPFVDTPYRKEQSLAGASSEEEASYRRQLRSSCLNTCDDAYDGTCDDGGPGSEWSVCSLGSDCADCGGVNSGGASCLVSNCQTCSTAN